jgi:hypothetical protein
MAIRHKLRIAAAGVALILTAASICAGAIEMSAALKVADIQPNGKLRKPADLSNWVFLGTSLGMGFNPGSFNAANPGQFQVVLMEPKAFEHFQQHGNYAPGSMFVLAFYGADTQKRSNNRRGFTQGDLTNFEIHYIGEGAGEDRHVFYMFGADDTEGTPLPPKNSCVRCHVDHGAFGGTFAQFYPVIRKQIPKEALEHASKVEDIR